MKSRDCNLDLLKIIACIAVVGLHTFYSEIRFLYYLCGFAVPIFFMMSGYFLLNKEKITWKYTMSKIVAIIKIVFMWNILRWILGCFLLFDVNIKDGGKELFEMFFLSFIQKGKMWQIWYLGALIILYLLLPVLHKLKKKLIIIRNNEISYLTIFWIVLVLTSVILQGISVLYRMSLQSHVIQTLRVWSWLQYFVLGGIVCGKERYLSVKISKRKHSLILFFYTIFLIGYQFVMGNYVMCADAAEYFYDSIFTIAWIIVLFNRVQRIIIPMKWKNRISKISSLTIGIYILHPIIILLVNRFFSGSSVIICFSTFLCVTIISFSFIWVLDKIPVMKKLFLAL